VDKNEDDVDDQYFENKMTNAPLCSTVWANKSVCNRKCKRLGYSAADDGWNASDQVLLGVLGVFSKFMCFYLDLFIWCSSISSDIRTELGLL